MSDEIPEDVMRKAQEAAERMADALWGHMGSHGSRLRRTEEIIARAIMAEREQCACIAESNNAWPSEGADIAAAIRGGP